VKLSLEKLKSGLFKTKESLLGRISQAVGLHKRIDQELLDELEEILIKADVGPSTTAKIVDGLKNEAVKRKIEDSDRVIELLKDQVASILGTGEIQGGCRRATLHLGRQGGRGDGQKQTQPGSRLGGV
jgi:signal recognition particle GTPase